MAKNPRYQEGQRWEFADGIPEFENTLVIGHVTPGRPEFGWPEAKYEAYVRFSPLARPLLRPDVDGVIFRLVAGALDRSVTKLMESNVKLPWWWQYGRRFKRKSDTPSGTHAYGADRISDELPYQFKREIEAAEEERREKEKEAKKAARKSGGKGARKASQSVAESWQRIEAAATELNGRKPNWNAGASTSAIKLFEKAIGLPLPDDFKESLRIHNGGNSVLPGNDHDFLTLEQILQQWRRYKEWQEKGEYALDNELWDTPDLKGPVKRFFWSPKRIPITDNSGDHLMLDLDPPAKGKYGQVLDHCHEVGPTCVLAPSWSAYLSQLVDQLEAGE